MFSTDLVQGSARGRAVRFESVLERLEALTKFLGPFEELHHFFALAKPGTQLGRRFGRPPIARGPTSAFLSRSFRPRRRGSGLRRAVPALGPMSIELGQRLGLLGDAVGLAAQAVGERIAALDALFVRCGERSLRGKFDHEWSMVLLPRAHRRARRP